MKAILILNGSGAMPMAHVLDRPLIQHVVEQLVDRGIREISLLCGKNGEAAARHLGEGARWGIRTESTILSATASKEDFVRVIQPVTSGPVLFGNAVRLPHLPLDLAETSPWNTLFFDDEDGIGSWSGWALLNAQVLPEFAAAVVSGSSWREASQSSGATPRKVFLDHPSLSMASAKDVLLANQRALNGEFPGLYFTGREKQPGVWVARGARIASSAVLHTPCYIGEGAWIGPGCNIGPNSVIGPGSVIEQRTSVVGSVIGARTFVGPELEFLNAVVMRNHVHNVRLDVDFLVDEAHIVSAL